MTARQTYRLPPLTFAFAGALLFGTQFASIKSADAQMASTATNANAAGDLQKDHGAWRSTKLDGATVYNNQGNSVGTVEDMLLDSSGHVSNVVLSVGGFLGMDSKYVEVPFSKLKFEPSKGNSASTSTSGSGMANSADYSIVLPNVSKDSLKSMTAFTF